ncbi:sensor histidine kinase [Thalassotalea ganghwensis]
MAVSFTRIKAVFSLFKLTNLLVIFIINSITAVLISFYRQNMTNGSFDVFVDELTFYFILLNILGFNIVFTYIYISRGAHQQLPLYKIVNIGLGALLLSLPFVLVIFDWGTSNFIHSLYLSFLYLLAIVLPVVWAIMLIFYIKRREAQPEFQLLKQQVAEQSLEREKIELELQLLQAQIEPHFFFNTLANLHCLIDQDSKKAKVLLESLTEYLRSTVPVYRQKFIELELELQMIKQYLNIQSIRFGDKLSYQVICDEDLYPLPILPLSLLTLVENAIKHGIEKSAKDGKVRIEVNKNDQQKLIMTVSDNAGLYKGSLSIIDNGLGHGTGLNNLKARLKIAYQNEAKLVMENVDKQLTIATIEVPVNG